MGTRPTSNQIPDLGGRVWIISEIIFYFLRSHHFWAITRQISHFDGGIILLCLSQDYVGSLTHQLPNPTQTP